MIEHVSSAEYAGLLHILPSSIVFDVGANAGNVTQVFVKVARHVYAFEPNAEIIALLKQDCPSK